MISDSGANTFQRFEVNTWINDHVPKDTFITWFIPVRGASQEELKGMNGEIAHIPQDAIRRKLISSGMLVTVNKKSLIKGDLRG